jgi:hypothetical protein
MIEMDLFLTEIDRILTPGQKRRIRKSRWQGKWRRGMPPHFGRPPRIIKSIDLEVKWLKNNLSLSREQASKIKNALVRFHMRPFHRRDGISRTSSKEMEFILIENLLTEKQKNIFKELKQDWFKERMGIYSKHKE